MPSAERVFRAFADPTRLRILSLLSGGELCVGDLVQLLGVPQPTASRHLAHLRRAGLVATRRNGLWSFYSLAEGNGTLARKLLECLADCHSEEAELAADARRAKALRKAGGCCPALARECGGERRSNARVAPRSKR